ncbi:hypothetical protein CR513_17269, partial [Mucuna pruriens]
MRHVPKVCRYTQGPTRAITFVHVTLTLIRRFRLLVEIVSDNSTQFASWTVADFCAQLKL